MKIKIKKFKNAAIFGIFWEGIPVFYYGGEQYFQGGADPLNRETMWGHYNTSSDLYIALGIANKIRREKKIWEHKLVQRFADNVFYAFTRGDVFIAVTRGEACERTITYHDFQIGDKLCNVLEENDCITVEEDGIKIVMKDEPKIFVKQ